MTGGADSAVPVGSRGVDVISIGEAMAVITPYDDEKLQDAERCQLSVGGAESNVLIQLARSGVRTRFVSRVGDDPFGRRVTQVLAGAGVDTSALTTDGDRPTGVYFKDRGQRGRASYYYRRGSAASMLTTAALAEARIEEACVLFLTGISPALSAELLEVTQAALVLARENDVAVYFDVNYREPLWPAAGASEPLLELARASDVVFVGLDEADTLWNATTAEEVRQLFGSWPGRLVVKDGPVGATEFHADEAVFAPAPTVTIIDEAGAGDAFAAGYLHAQLAGATAAERLQSGHRQAALALATTDDVPDQVTS